MHGIKGEIEKKRLGTVAIDTVAIDEGERLAAEGIGQVFGLGDALGAAEDFGPTASVRDVGMRAAEEAEEFVKAALGRPEALPRAEVPFADDARRIAGPFEPFGQRRFVAGQAEGFGLEADRTGIELVSEPLLIPARHEAGPRRAADGAGDIAARKADAVVRDRVDMRRGDVLPPLAAEFAVSQIVGDDHQDIRPRAIGGGRAGGFGRCRLRSGEERAVRRGRRKTGRGHTSPQSGKIERSAYKTRLRQETKPRAKPHKIAIQPGRYRCGSRHV